VLSEKEIARKSLFVLELDAKKSLSLGLGTIAKAMVEVDRPWFLFHHDKCCLLCPLEKEGNTVRVHRGLGAKPGAASCDPR
jgi:hypothetical protein